MGIFARPEVVILKESSDAKEYLQKLNTLLPDTTGALRERLQKEILITKAGIAGEDNILFELRNSNMDMVVLHDIYMETANGLGAQIDFLVVTPKCNIVIECKNLFGDIEIDHSGNFIRTMYYGGRKHREGIYSPVTQSRRHLDVLAQCRMEQAGLMEQVMQRLIQQNADRPLVVLANPKTVVYDRYAQKEIKQQVIKADQLNATIRRILADCKTLPCSKKEMLERANRLLAMNRETRKDYIKKYEELQGKTQMQESQAAQDRAQMQEPQAAQDKAQMQVAREAQDKAQMQAAREAQDRAQMQTAQAAQDKAVEKTAVPLPEPVAEKTDEKTAEKGKEAVICPKCGAAMVIRTAGRGARTGKQFYGCSAFPKCRYSMDMEEQ